MICAITKAERGGPEPDRGGQDSNGALSKYAPLATLVAYGALLKNAPLLSQGKGVVQYTSASGALYVTCATRGKETNGALLPGAPLRI